MIKLNEQQIISIHNQLAQAFQFTADVRDEELLKTIVDNCFPDAVEQKYDPSVFRIAAKLCYELATQKPFVQNNFLCSVHTALVFLHINGIDLKVQTQDFELLAEIMSQQDANAQVIHQWIMAHI